MVYKEFNGKIHLVPSYKTENPDEWPEVILPLSELSAQDWETFAEKINQEMLTIYNGKNEGELTKQVVIQRLQRTLIVFLNSLWSNK